MEALWDTLATPGTWIRPLVLRTGIYKDGTVYIQAGGGVVADSDPRDEFEETLHKAGALFRAIDIAEGRSG